MAHLAADRRSNVRRAAPSRAERSVVHLLALRPPVGRSAPLITGVYLLYHPVSTVRVVHDAKVRAPRYQCVLSEVTTICD